MNVIISSENYARHTIATIKNRGGCYDLLPEVVGNKIKVSYIVDGDRIGWYESSKTFSIPQLDDGQNKHSFVVHVVRDIKRLLVGQETGLAVPYWEQKEEGENFGRFKSNVCF